MGVKKEIILNIVRWLNNKYAHMDRFTSHFEKLSLEKFKDTRLPYLKGNHSSAL